MLLQANAIKLTLFRALHRNAPSYQCPACGYEGPFRDLGAATGRRLHAECPNCHAMERHRLQFLVLDRILAGATTSTQRMLHFAPEPIFRAYFAKRFDHYETADIAMKGVDHYVDLQGLPFPDASYDFVFASHVLEHVPDDDRAISEIRRILKPSGVAVLPVPLVAERTIEYGAPNPHEHGHVRAPGPDYFERYRRHFSRVETSASDAWPERHQLFILEDRSIWPTAQCPLRPAMQGQRHMDMVPVCYA